MAKPRKKIGRKMAKKRPRQRRDYARIRKEAIGSNPERILKAERTVMAKWVQTGRVNRKLGEVERDQGVKFQHEIDALKRVFPGEEIQVLDEGCGLSSFADELRQKGVKVSRSDLVNMHSPPIWPFKKLRIPMPGFHQVSVHKLAEHFGKNKFHMVVSSRGGVDWGGSIGSAIANIFEILKPRGKAFITTTGDPSFLAESARKMGIKHKTRWNGIVLFK